MTLTWLDAAKALVRGSVLGVLAFLAFVFAVGAISSHSDRSLIDQKISAAIRDETIQIPGRWDITDPRGMDTFTDCLMLESLLLSPDRFLPNLFATYIYDKIEIHPCDLLSRVYKSDGAAPAFPIMSYSRYWWGAASLAKIALGETGLSLAQYRNVVFVSLILALGVFTITFYQSYQRASLFFTPYLMSVWCGFSLFSLGQSISQTPEEIIGLLILSIYNVMSIESRSRCIRAACYSFLGAICVYLDLMNGVVILVATIMCCQWTASTLSKHSAMWENQILSVITNLSLLGIGACFAIVVRLVGYSYVSGKGLFDTLYEWKNALTYRAAGNLPDGSAATLWHMVGALKGARADPFYGVLSKHGAEVWYALGLLGWVLLVPLCWGLVNKQKLPLNVLSGFLLTGVLIPVWFLIFKQHTIIHAWMTGRLLGLFAGLGMSAAITMLAILKTRAAPLMRN